MFAGFESRAPYEELCARCAPDSAAPRPVSMSPLSQPTSGGKLLPAAKLRVLTQNVASAQVLRPPSLQAQNEVMPDARCDRRVMYSSRQLPRSCRACQQTGGSICEGLKMFQSPLDGENAYCSRIKKRQPRRGQEWRHRSCEFFATRSVVGSQPKNDSCSGHTSKDLLCLVQHKCMSRIELDYKPVLAARPT